MTPETPSGTIDGTNPTFTTASAIANELLFVDRVAQVPGVDYTAASNVITFLSGSIPQPGALIRIYYSPLVSGTAMVALSDVKAWGGIANPQSDSILNRLILVASDFIRVYTSRTFAVETVTEIRDGSGGRELFLRKGPATSITSLAVCAVAIPAQAADGRPGYFLDDTGNLLCLESYRYERGRKNVRLSYTAGPASVPNDIAQACAELVIATFKRGKRGPEMKTETVAPGGSQSFSFLLADVPPSVEGTLNRWKRVVPV